MRITHSRISHLLAAFAAAIIALPPTLPIVASPAMEKLFFILKSKGSLTQDEYDMLVAAMRADEKSSPAPASAPASGSSSGLGQRLAKTESKIESLENVISNTRGQVEEFSKITDNTSPATMSKADLDVLLADKWYERLKLKGYVQTRLYSLLGDDDVPGAHQANDPFVSDTQSMGIRRGRLTFSGDVTNHLYLYAQMDMFATNVNSAGGTGTNVLQARDMYADISLDPAREFRARIGLSKVPYGFTNLQSSQNRLALERPDALNSAVEGERDMGAYLIWAPYIIRERFKNIVKMGLRGSGDYGLLNVGVYNGSGINNNDNNGKMHYIAHAAYPFEFDNGQFLEIGASFYTGQFKPGTTAIVGTTPTVHPNGVLDQRTAVNVVLYPQPFGIEAEWTFGKGPQLSNDMKSITTNSLEGGYIQACYRHVFPNQSELIPFVRLQQFDGARKFAANAPKMRVNEVAFGLRYIPYPELEMSLIYSNGTRTNTTDNPAAAGTRYRDVNVSYIGLQAQINF